MYLLEVFFLIYLPLLKIHVDYIMWYGFNKSTVHAGDELDSARGWFWDFNLEMYFVSKGESIFQS